MRVPGFHGRLQQGGTSRRTRQLVRYATPYRGRVLLALVGMLGATAVAIGGPVVVKQAIDGNFAIPSASGRPHALLSPHG